MGVVGKRLPYIVFQMLPNWCPALILLVGLQKREKAVTCRCYCLIVWLRGQDLNSNYTPTAYLYCNHFKSTLVPSFVRDWCTRHDEKENWVEICFSL